MSEEDEISEQYKDMIDRERGVLTRGDRKLLLGKAEYDTEQQRRNARYRLRKHLRNGIVDLSLVAIFIDDSELLQVETDPQKSEDTDVMGLATRIERGLFQLGFRSIFAKKAKKDGSFVGYDSKQTFEEEEYINNSVRSAIVRANKSSNCDPLREVSVEVSIDRTKFEEDEFIEKLVHGNPTHAEFSTYLNHGDINRLREKLRQNNEVVDIDSVVYTIGPDDETFTRHPSQNDS